MFRSGGILINSGFVEAYPLKERTVKEVASCLSDYFMRFGWPKFPKLFFLAVHTEILNEMESSYSSIEEFRSSLRLYALEKKLRFQIYLFRF